MRCHSMHGHHGFGGGYRAMLHAMRGGPFRGWGWDAEGRGGRHGGRRRMFDGGQLRLVLLKLLADQPRHGYDLIRAIEERTGGAYAPSPGIVYPTLTLLADMGHIEEQDSPGARKLFAITAEGIAHIEENAGEIERIMARLDALGAERDRTDIVPVKRAIHNLRAVLEHRLATDPDRATINEAVALIDEVARKIEQL